MSVETEITITCNRCGEKSTSENQGEFCSKVNLPSPEHFNNFKIEILRHGRNETGIDAFGMNIIINRDADLCPKCRRWINEFFNEQADNIRTLLEQEWGKNDKERQRC